MALENELRMVILNKKSFKKYGNHEELEKKLKMLIPDDDFLGNNGESLWREAEEYFEKNPTIKDKTNAKFLSDYIINNIDSGKYDYCKDEYIQKYELILEDYFDYYFENESTYWESYEYETVEVDEHPDLFAISIVFSSDY